MGHDDLPDVYQVALELRAAGVDHAGIAERIGVDEVAIANLLRLADAKASRAAVAAGPPGHGIQRAGGAPTTAAAGRRHRSRRPGR